VARTATIRALEDTDLLKIGKDDFDRLVCRRPSAGRRREADQPSGGAISNPQRRAALMPPFGQKVASGSLDHLNRHETR